MARVTPPKAAKPSATWTFAARFRRGAFGWKSDLAIKRLKEAVSEIRAAARKDPALGAEGAVRLIEKLSPAFENVDDSSGRLQGLIRQTFDICVPLIGTADVPATVRQRWLERLWQAVLADEMPWIQGLGDDWGALCGSPEVASAWADEFLPTLRSTWSAKATGHGWFPGSVACLSCLFRAGRHAELLVLLESPHTLGMWAYHRWGVDALLAQGRRHEALAMAEDCFGKNHRRPDIARACESILIDMGLREVAYRQYALAAHLATTHLATLRAIAARYPEREKASILGDLVAATPGQEGKWFAAAKDMGLLGVALHLARMSPTDPRTLARAARDHVGKEPAFALEAGLLALGWMARGHGYEITSADVVLAWNACLAAGPAMGLTPQAVQVRAIALCDGKSASERFVHGVVSTLSGR